MKRKKISKIQSKNWFNKLNKEEVIQEEQIQLWKHPELEGYQGILAYVELYSQKVKEEQSPKYLPLKKNTPANSAGVFISNDILLEFINQFEESDRSKICIILQPYMDHIYYGKDLKSIREQAKEMQVSKSSLGRLYSFIRYRLQSAYRSLLSQ